jgi:hypothetical protein
MARRFWLSQIERREITELNTVAFKAWFSCCVTGV